MKQFSIRDLLFLILVIALALGWWLDRRPIPARFQMHATENQAFVLDTATGQTWSHPSSDPAAPFARPKSAAGIISNPTRKLTSDGQRIE
jgi:hypothetical protein